MNPCSTGLIELNIIIGIELIAERYERNPTINARPHRSR